MDPLTALGLAANIAQFIDFGSRLVSTTREIAKAGSSVSVAHLSTITSDLVDFNNTLKNHLSPAATKVVPVTQEQHSLIDLAEQCQKRAEEFIDALNQVTRNSEKKSTWENVRSALRTIWNKDRFESVARQLGDYRGQLTLRVLLLLNSHQRQQGDQLSLLHRDNKEIVEVISINRGVLQSKIDGYYKGEQLRQQKDCAEAKRRHAETIAAILTTRDGNSTAITSTSYSAGNSLRLSGTASTSTTTTYKQAGEQQALGQGEAPDFETTEFTSFTKIVLDALHFRSINSRRAAVPRAHQNTFQWIYRDPESCDKPWDNFSEWLRSGKGCYWINGKAGSGKSTLMKFLQQDQRTNRALREWAAREGGSELVVGSFFFWYAGTSLQKTQTGLLRSLLFDVLNRRCDLIPVLFPDVCRSILSKQSPERIELSYIELRKAFTTLVGSVPTGLKVFFMVDGIDEYEGDHNEISELLYQATTSSSVKMLLSSRPIPACVQVFSACHSLRLQDLTRKDVQRYVQDKLGRNPLMQKLEIADKGATDQLISSITSKASGVLLWVVLVVRSLINGLQDYDTTSDLLQKLDELPPDLERLYDHMLGSMSPQNQRQGSKMLQLVLRSTETQEDYTMTLFQLSFAEDEDYKKSVEAPISALSIQEEDWRCESTEGRMRSRCCGLIEVRNDSFSSEYNRSVRSVDFLHRTVVEFLRTDTIWVQLVSLTNGTKFDVNKALLSSCLAEMKAKPPAPEYKEYETTAYYSMLRMLSYERHMEDTKELFHKLYLPEIKRTMSCHWYEPKLFPSPGIQAQAMSDAAVRASSRLAILYPESFLFFAASHCPKSNLQGLLKWHIARTNHGTTPIPAKDPERDMLQAYLFIQYMDETQIPLQIVLSANIVVCGGDPNRSVCVASGRLWKSRWKEAVHQTGNWSLWEAVLHHSLSITRFDDKEILKFVQSGLADSHWDIVISILEAGADANQKITILSKGYHSTKAVALDLSASEVLHSFMLRVWSGRVPKEPPHTSTARAAATRLQNTLAEKACVVEGALGPGKPELQAPAKPQTVRFTTKSASRHQTLEKQSDKPDPESSPWVIHCGQLPMILGTPRAAVKTHELKRQQKQKSWYAKPGTSSSLSSTDLSGSESFLGNGHDNSESHPPKRGSRFQESEYAPSDNRRLDPSNTSDGARSKTTLTTLLDFSRNHHAEECWKISKGLELSESGD